MELDADKATKITGLKGLIQQTGGETLLKAGPAALARHTAAETNDDAPELSPEEEQTAEQVLATFEAAFLVAAADGELSDDEVGELSELLAHMTDGQVGEADLAELIDTYAEALQTDGFEGRVGAVAETLTDADMRRAAFVTASGLAYVDGEIHEAEEQVFTALADAFEIPEAEANELLDKIEQALGVDRG